MNNPCWVIVDRETGDVLLETYSQAVIDAINSEKYEVKTAVDHLLQKNKKHEKMPKNVSRDSLIKRLGFEIVSRSGIDVLKWEDGGSRPATVTEVDMWIELTQQQGGTENE